MEYIDVRGPWPILFIGLRAYELQGQPRTISVVEAKKILGLDKEN